jgi:hypothetical protein
MANKKISQLPPATDVAGAEVEIIQGGVNKRASSSLFGGSTSTPTLLEVLTEGNEAPDVDAKIKRIGLYNIPEAEYNYIEAFDTEWRFLNANPDRNFKFDVNTLQGEKLYLLINQDGAIPTKAIQNSNFTAVGYAEYSTISNLTITDPTPIEGIGYTVTVINGTATIGGVGYTVGQKVFRHYHSGSWRSFIYGGSGTASTLQEVTEAGPETTVKTIFRTSETEWIEIGGDNNGIAVYNDEFGSLPTPKSIIDIGYNGLGVNSYDTDTGESTGFAGIGGKTLQATEIVGGVAVKSTAITPDKIVKRINATTSFESFLPSEDNDLNGSKVISANTTAKNAINYLAVANLTMTDITPPSEGAFYEVTVINGTATIGGVGYTVGQKVFRHYHSGSWRTFVSQNASSLSKIVIKDTSSSAPVTGSTLNTLAKTYEIQGVVFDGNDAFNLKINAQKSSTFGTSTIRVYVNTVNNFATATLYSTTTSAAASVRDITSLRSRSNFKGTNLIVVEPAFTLLNDLNQGFNAPRTAIPLNPANTFFLFVAIQNANAGDSTTIESVHLTT